MIFAALGVFVLSACHLYRGPMSLDSKYKFLTGAINKHQQHYALYMENPAGLYTEGINKKSHKWSQEGIAIIDFQRGYNQNLKKIRWIITTNDRYNGHRDHVFEGTPVPRKDLEKEGLREFTAESKTGLVSEFRCLKVNCEDIFVIIKQNGKQVGDIFVAKEKRKARIHLEEKAAQAIAKDSSELAKFYIPNNKVDMDVTIIQSRPGFSRIRIQYSDVNKHIYRNIIDISGELLYDVGICTPLYFSGLFKYKGKYCMLGNNNKGQLIVNYNTFIGNQEYNADIFIEKDSTYFRNVRSTKEETAKLPFLKDMEGEKELHPVIDQLIPDFHRKEIQDVASDIWGPSSDMKDFLHYHERAIKGPVKGSESQKVKDFKTVVGIIEENPIFPRAIIFKTLVESSFEPEAEGPILRDKNRRVIGRAVGLWQFMPHTGKDYGLENKRDRKDVRKSTMAAMEHMKRLYSGSYSGTWKGDIKLAIAAYNWGHGSLQKTIDNKVDRTTKKSMRGKAMEIKDAERVSWYLNCNSENGGKNLFWCLRDLGLLSSDGQTEEHVIKVVSAIMVGLDPEAFGYKDVIAFPATE